jgi:hypothetical protein
MELSVQRIVNNADNWSSSRISQAVSRLGIQEIAQLIDWDWTTPSPYAQPHINVMYWGDYDMDKEKLIIKGFLEKSAKWDGKIANAVKLELKKRIKA